MSKSFVTLECCCICGEETGTLMLDRRMKDTFERKTACIGSFCDSCKEKYLSEGVFIFNDEPYQFVILKDDAFKNLFGAEIPEGRIAKTDKQLINWLLGEYKKHHG